MSTQRPRQPQFSPTSLTPKHFPCTICKKPTDQTCSLCRRVFYCSSEHQQIDWHMRHKLQCQGKILSNTAPVVNQGNQWNTNQTVMYNGGEGSSGKEGVYYSEGAEGIERKAGMIRLENQARQFMGMFEQRLILRKRAVERYLRLSGGETSTNSNTNTTNQQPQQTLPLLLQQLTQTSQTLLTLFKPSFTPILQQTYGITTSQFILTLDSTLDRALLAKYHLLTHKHQEVRRFLFAVHDQLPSYPSDADARVREVYENVLKTVLGVSEVHCNDKVTEGVMARFVRVVERFDGLWEQIGAYFNMGNWYLQKTYHHKAIRAYNHSLDLLNTHHKARSQLSDSSILTKADLLYNMSLAQHCINDHKPAFDNMQESYRLRTKAIGKNSIQASHCLQALSRWAFTNKYWEDCLQYARECYRVRKLNSGNYPRDLERVEKLLESIYGQLKREKERSELEMGNKPAKYYETLLTTNNPSQSNLITPLPQPQPHQSFIKQLSTTMMNEQPQLIQPKVIITPQMAQTYTSTQWEKLTKLLYDTDRLMEKEEFRRVIFQSEFTESLGEGQRDVFVRVNKVE